MKAEELPKVGDKIYVGSSYYLGHGRDDFEGGLATIRAVDISETLPIDHINAVMIRINERTGWAYNYKVLLDQQEELKSQFGDQAAFADPDDREEFNED